MHIFPQEVRETQENCLKALKVATVTKVSGGNVGCNFAGNVGCWPPMTRSPLIQSAMCGWPVTSIIYIMKKMTGFRNPQWHTYTSNIPQTNWFLLIIISLVDTKNFHVCYYVGWDIKIQKVHPKQPNWTWCLSRTLTAPILLTIRPAPYPNNDFRQFGWPKNPIINITDPLSSIAFL